MFANYDKYCMIIHPVRFQENITWMHSAEHKLPAAENEKLKLLPVS